MTSPATCCAPPLWARDLARKKSSSLALAPSHTMLERYHPRRHPQQAGPADAGKSYELMKTHAEKGAELLSKIPQMREHAAYRYAYDIALHHHERWDGGGYPHHLVGNQTPIWTQIVSLADVYDALVSKRCYKDALSAQEAVEMISNGQCGAFNPELLHCFRQAEPVLRRFYRPMEEKQHGGG